jgi:hypothetical protein
VEIDVDSQLGPGDYTDSDGVGIWETPFYNVKRSRKVFNEYWLKGTLYLSIYLNIDGTCNKTNFLRDDRL